MAIADLVRANYKKLNENDLYIWNYIDNHRKECCQCTIEELGRKCSVSRTTILRFAKKLSMDGFSELKIHLKMEEEKICRPSRDIIQMICNDNRKCIDDLEKADFSRICKLIYEAKRIFVYGSGAVQSFVAKELKRAFLSAQVAMYHIEGHRGEQELIADLVEEGDIVFIISLSGESRHVTEFAKSLKLKNTPMISITRMKNNTLAQMCDESVYVTTSEVDTDYIADYEATSMFFMTVEMLLIKYLLYVNERCMEYIE